ncbi:hypothetical protein OROMI_026391 [Orobanche minor]
MIEVGLDSSNLWCLVGRLDLWKPSRAVRVFSGELELEEPAAMEFSGMHVSRELDKLLEDAPSPLIMQHAARILGLRKRVNALNTVLKSIQRQIDNMDRMLELDKLLEDAPSPFIMQHAARISGIRKRVSALKTVLKSIQRQIDNMDRMLSAGHAVLSAVLANVHVSSGLDSSLLLHWFEA